MKTLRVTLADIIGHTGTLNSTATVHARYVDTSGRGRDVHLTDGTIVVPVRRVASPDGDPEVFDFDVYANDVAPVREVDYGVLVEVSWTVVAPTGAKTSGVRRVAITDDMDATVQLGLLAQPTPVAPYTGGYALAPDLAAEVVTRAAADSAHAADTTDVHGITDTAALVLTTDPRLSDARTPTAHTHALAEVTDAGTAAAADVGDFATAAQGVKADTAVQPARTVTAGTGLTGGGDLSADRTLTVAYGTTATTATVGNDSRVTGAAQKSANLSDLADAATARTNLGLNTAATVGALPIPDPGSFYPTDTITAALQLIGGRHIYGTGSPEGAVTAPVGTYYTDTAITNGALRWAKKTGTGNTGWACVEGDTGWRKVVGWTSAGVITGTMPTNLNPVTGVAGGVFMRRVDSTVQFSVVAGVTTSTSVAGAIPDGFSGGQVPYPQVLISATSSGGSLVVRTLHAGLVTWTLASITSGDQFAGPGSAYGSTASWLTTQGWPTTLPGVAA